MFSPTDESCNGEVTACYKLVGLVEWVDLGYFVKLYVKDSGESSARTFLYFRYFFGAEGGLPAAQNS